MEALLEGVAHQRQELGYSHHVRDPLLLQDAHDVCAAARRNVVDRGPAQHGIEQAAGQLEQVREGQNAAQTTRLIQWDAIVKGFDLCAQVGVADHAAFGLAGRARGEEDRRELL